MAAEVAGPNLPKQEGDEEALSLQLSLAQMLDLALGSPEVGAINLNILHNFLHVLLHLVNLDSAKVEYRGDHASRLKTVVETRTKGPSVQLQEYNITDGEGQVRQREAGKEAAEGAEGADVYTEASAPASAGKEPSNDNASEVSRTKGVKRQVGPGSEGKGEKVIFVEPVVDGVAPSALGFKRLDQSVKELERRYRALEELQSNAEIMERLKGKIGEPLTDIWQVINIGKRLDAHEQGIDKLTSMLQDLARNRVDGLPTEGEADEHLAGESDGSMADAKFTQRIKQIEDNVTHMEEAISDLQAAMGQTPVQLDSDALAVKEEDDQDVAETGEVDKPPEIAVKRESSKEQQADEAAEVDKSIEHASKRESRKKQLSVAGGLNIVEMHSDVEALKTEISQMRTDVYDLNAKIEGLLSGRQEEEEDGENFSGSPGKENASQCWEAIGNLEKTYNDDLSEVKNRLAELEKEMERGEGPGMVGDSDLNELVGKIQSIQSDIEKFNKMTDRLVDDKEDRETHINALLEQIELLKTIKADKEDLEDALADKADAQVVNRKVSHDQFDAACDDLARGLEDAVAKLGRQETVWQEALDEVQREIEGKVDKLEITPLKDFVSNRLKSLQEKLKKVAEMNQETDAAGTKKILRDVQCISCDKKVVMKMEESKNFQAQPLPCTMSMKPYLTYELDQVRKQQRRLPHGRNLHMLEAAMQEESRKIKSAREESLKTPRDHLCNRYCGGSHTVTTPQQRVTRMSHFLTQWGPKMIQLTDGVLRGPDDRCKVLPGRPDVCGSFCEGQDTPPMESERTSQPPRKSQQSKRSSTASRRKNSRKSSGEPAAKMSVPASIAEEAPHRSSKVERFRSSVEYVEEETANEVA